MPISPMYQTATPLWQISVVTDSSAETINALSLSAFSMVFQNSFTKQDVAGTGTFSIPGGTTNVVNYQFSTNDGLLAPTLYDVILWVVFSNGPRAYDLGSMLVKQK